MSCAERWVIRFWWLVTVLAAIAILLPGLLILLVFGVITIPLAALGFAAPSIWLYLSPAILLYTLLRRLPALRRAPRLLLVVPACAVPLAMGYAAASLINQRIEARVAEMMSADMGAPVSLPPVGTAAYLSRKPDGWTDYDRQCNDLCQRLLFTGTAQRVIVGPASALDGAGDRQLMMHEIVANDGTCDNALLAAAPANVEIVIGAERVYLWKKLGEFADQGRCFRSRPVASAEADAYLLETYPDWTRRDRVRGGYDWRLIPVDLVSRHELQAQRGNKKVRLLRRSQLTYSHLAAPVQIEPFTDISTGNPGGWRNKGERRLGESRYGPGAWLADDLRVDGVEPEPQVVRGGRR